MTGKVSLRRIVQFSGNLYDDKYLFWEASIIKLFFSHLIKVRKQLSKKKSGSNKGKTFLTIFSLTDVDNNNRLLELHRIMTKYYASENFVLIFSVSCNFYYKEIWYDFMIRWEKLLLVVDTLNCITSRGDRDWLLQGFVITFKIRLNGKPAPPSFHMSSVLKVTIRCIYFLIEGGFVREVQ